MTAPNLALRNCLYVNYVGTDDLGYDAIGAPWSYRTIGAALISLALQTNPPSATNPWTISIGPGVFTEVALVLPAWVWLTGSPDGETGQNTTVQISQDLTLDPDWADGATRGGLANLVIRAASGTPALNLSIPAPGVGTPARGVELENITTDLEIITFLARSPNDSFDAKRLIQDGSATDLVSLSGGSIRVNDAKINSGLAVRDQGEPAVAILQGVVMDSAARLTVNSTTHTVTARLVGCSVPLLTLTETAPGVVALQVDNISLPLRANITYGGTAANADVTRLTDANAEAYSPVTPANWAAPAPTTTQEALDDLAGAVGPSPGGSNSAIAVANAAGNTTVTPTGRNYFAQLSFTGAAGTRIAILAVAAPPTIGDMISLFLTRADGGGIIVEVRNATAGGTLLATLPDGIGGSTARFDFIYGTIAAGFAADAWIPWSYAIPATS